MLQIIPITDQRLTQPCRPIENPTDVEVRVLVHAMFETMQIAGGAGLAAPQVGYDVRLFVMIEVPGATAAPTPITKPWQTKLALINPAIVGRSPETVNRKEGCLSMPGVYFEVERSAWVDVRWSDLDGVERTRRFEGFAAICAQHEIDHLDGVRSIDRVSSLKRAMLLKKFADVRRRKSRPR